MTYFLRHLIIAGLVLLLGAASAHASSSVLSGPQTEPGSGIDIEVRSFYEELPRRGFLPLRITISNNSGKQRTWEATFLSQANESGTVRHQVALTVADGEAKQFNLLVPLVRSNYYGQFTAHITGFGFEGGTGTFHLSGRYSGHTTPYPPAIAMSEKLAQVNWDQLDALLPNLNGSSFGHSMLSSMSADWRGFAGFDSVWISDQEWLSTGAAERLTVLDWVAVGGILYLCREENDQTPLPNLENLTVRQPVRRGLGEIRRWTRTGDNLDLEATKDELNRQSFALHNQLEDFYRRASWPLLGSLPEVKVRKTLFIGFLLLFAAVIGPVNLFVFARGARRHRLFWTTPAISLAASLMIFLLILLQDGVGGTGRQLALWTYLPNENKAVFLQEQASRTALLTRRQFSVDTPVSLSAINIMSLASVETGNFHAGHRSFSGDWFRNRSTQAHLLAGVTATRSRLEAGPPLAGGGPPQLLSTFPFNLESVFYCDADGTWWHAADLAPGKTRTFERVEDDAFERAWREFLADAGKVIERRASTLSNRPGHFYAFSDKKEGTWQTLKSIDWQTRKSLHTGPVAAPQP